MFVAMPFRSLAALLSSSLVLFGVLALVSPAPAQPLSLADADLILMGAHAGESSGHWIATAGDVNGDGFADLLVGANRAPNLNDKDTGRVSLIYGGPSLPPVIDLANPLPGSVVQILGTATGDKLGVSVTDLGDFNGDGFDDFALGARGASFLGRSDAGVVYLIFGGASLPPVIDTSSLGASGIVIGGAEARDELGRAVSGAGDFNNDGHPDLLMGAWKADAMGLSNAGRAFILFGGPGLPGVIDLAGAGAAGVVFEGARAGDSAGYAVADLGDFNGDGIDDVVITAEHADPNGSKSGEAYVVLGQANPPAVVSLKDPIASGISATILHGALPGDNLGHACAGAGDFDGDGLDDLVISSEDADRNGLHEVGEVYLIFGSAAPPAIIEVAGLGALGVTFRGIGEDDELGRSLHGLGDVNGDGRADFIIGAHGVRPSGVYEAGAAYVIFGGQSLPPLVTGPDLAAAGQEYDGIDAGDKAGWSVTGAGDMNRDFGGDFAVSAKGADPLGRSNAGETYLFFGEPIEPPTALACSADGGTVTVTWTNGELYDTVVIIRDGVVIATLPGTDSSFVDTGVAPGLHSYEIYGTIGIFRSAATAECVVDIPPPPENPTCSAIGDTPTITWSNPVIYDEIRVSRNGVLIATLAGTETSYDDPGLAPGIYLYEVRGVVGGTPSDPAQCSAEVLAPITDFVCSAIAHTVFLSWTNGQAYSFIELFRDGILEAELPGATNSYTDLEVPAGLHTYSLVAHGPSTETLPVACEIVVLDQPFNAACTSENGFVTLTWQNGSVYDGIEIERNGVLVATLPGTATIFTETVPPGTYLYEITGTAPNSESAKTPCEVVAPGCPSGLQCSAVGEEATLTWVNAELYDDVLVTLDGTVIQTLAGDATATGISPLAPGTYTICVVGVINGGTCEACCELTVPIPPTNAACSAVGNVVTLTWTNGETYDFIDILRNGVQIDTVAGSMESYTDTEVPVGLHTYGIVATIDGGTTLPLPCEVEVLPPISVECAAEAGNVTLSWSPGGEYDTVEILRDGVLIAQVPGVEGSFIDEGVAPGTYVYTLTGLSGTSQTDPVDCTVIVPEPVIELECSLADGVTVTLEWTNVEVEGTVLVLRNEQLITTLGGSVSTYTEGPMAPGVYVYCVINEIDGNTSVPTCCEVVVPVPPTMLLCHSTVEGPEVAWMNGEAYDSILVFRDGVLLDELAGDAESYLDPGLPAGEYEYRIIGVVQGFHSAPATCTVSVPHPPEVTCSEQNPNFVLNITLLSTFESIVVLRNGEQVAQVAPIPGTVFEHHDQVPLPGSYFYEVIGVVGDEDVSQPGECNGVMLVFVRGDANNDMELDIADIVWILNYLFQDGPPPPCMDAADTNSDGFVNVADAVYMAGYLFLDGLPPEAPFPTPGLDPYDPAVEEPEDKDQLGCASSVWD